MSNVLAAWTLGSIVLFVLSARTASTSLARRTAASPVGRVFLEVARFAYYLGLPYLALLAGVFSARDASLQGSPSPELFLGWTPEAWMRALGQAAALAVVAISALALLNYQIRQAGGYAWHAIGVPFATLAQSIRESVYAEAHWSFYRVLPVIWLADTRWAALAGLALTGIEAILAGRAEQSDPRVRPLEAVLAGASATFYALTGGNLWIAVALQTVTRTAAGAMAHAGQKENPASELVV